MVAALGGEPRLIAREGRRPRFSPDGNQLAYWMGATGTGLIPGSMKIYVAALEGGQPRQVHPEFVSARHPVWMPDGKRLLFWGRLDAKTPPDWWVAPVDGSAPVTTGALDAIRARNLSLPPGEYAIYPETLAAEGDRVFFSHVSSGGRRVLLESSGSPESIILADVASARIVDLIQSPDPKFIPFAARFSPDDRWIAFHVRTTNPMARQILITPFRGGQVCGPEEWIAVTDGSTMDRESYWSPDGSLLYFLSERDGFRCIWAQRLHAETKRPLGSAFAVHHFHHARRSLTGGGGSPGAIGMCVTPDSIVFALAELTGNIWSADLGGRK